jgi:hypothetical protein
MDAEGFKYCLQQGRSDELPHLMVTKPMAIASANHYAHVLYIDCMYKTNIYQMPLLNIVATTATNTSFIVVFAFLHAKKEEDYYWAITSFKSLLHNVPVVSVITDNEMALRNALARVFPEWKRLLCIWHINQNVVAKCKPGLPSNIFDKMMQQWQNLVYAPSRPSHLALLQAFTDA